MANKRTWKKRRQKALGEATSQKEMLEVLTRMQKDLGEMKETYPKFYKEYINLKEHSEKKYILQFIRLREEIRDSVVKAYKKGANAEIGVKYLKMLFHTVTDILEDYGVEIWASEEGEEFDPKIHKIVSKIEVEEEEKHATIAEVVNSGYKWRGLVLQKMEVVVYRFS